MRLFFGLFSSDLAANKPLIFAIILANKEDSFDLRSTGVGAASEIESATAALSTAGCSITAVVSILRETSDSSVFSSFSQ